MLAACILLHRKWKLTTDLFPTDPHCQVLSQDSGNFSKKDTADSFFYLSKQFLFYCTHGNVVCFFKNTSSKHNDVTMSWKFRRVWIDMWSTTFVIRETVGSLYMSTVIPAIYSKGILKCITENNTIVSYTINVNVCTTLLLF